MERRWTPDGSDGDDRRERRDDDASQPFVAPGPRAEISRRALLGGAAATSLALVGGEGLARTALAVGFPYRAFRNSYWNRPLPIDARRAERSAAMVDFLRQTSGRNHVRLAGTSSSGRFGLPIYWAGDGSPTYDVLGSSLPPEFSNLRVPHGAEADVSSDGALCVFDRGRGWVAWLFRASFANGRWSAGGGAIHRLRSNGLDRSWRCANRDLRNRGHRGMPGAVAAIRWDEIQAGVIPHVLRIGVPAASARHVFPMVNSDGDSSAPAAPPQGARLRIKPSVPLGALHRQGRLSRAGLIVARCLKRYGAVVGDESGDTMIKVEHTIAEGRGWLWRGRLGLDSLHAIPFGDYEFVRLGWGRCD
jgi:hypothetical protein